MYDGTMSEARAAHDAEVQRRAAAAVEQGTEAFWAVVAGLFPEIMTGDLDPGAVARFELATRSAVAAWIGANQPDGL